MKINNEIRYSGNTQGVHTYETPATAPAEEETEAAAVVQEREEAREVPAYVKAFEEKQRLLESFKKMSETQAQPQAQSAQERPRDNSSQLTRRLVAASGQFEVRQISAEAGSDIVKLRMALIGLKGKEAASVRQTINRLEKLLSRASRKVRDLDSEDILKLRKARAEKEKQEKRAKEIKEELRKKQMNRMQREHSYLRDTGSRKDESDDFIDRANSAVEAEITAQAEALAAVEIAMESGGAVSVDGGGEVAAASGEVSAEVSAEAALDE